MPSALSPFRTQTLTSFNTALVCVHSDAAMKKKVVVVWILGVYYRSTTKYFGREYTKKQGVPNCCMREAWRYNCEWIEEKKKEEEEKREEEEEYG
jgi:hypothetical protein